MPPIRVSLANVDRVSLEILRVGHPYLESSPVDCRGAINREAKPINSIATRHGRRNRKSERLFGVLGSIVFVLCAQNGSFHLRTSGM
jgi:hypothetical protein